MSRLLLAAALGLMLTWSCAAFAQDPRASDASNPPVPAEQTPPSRGLLPEPPALTAVVRRVLDRDGGAAEKKDGFYPRFGVGMSGSGWIAAGPGYRQHVGRVVIDASGALSWRQYAIGDLKATIEPVADRLTLSAQALWQDQTQVNYYGAGAGSLRSNRSEYRLLASDYTMSAIARSRGAWSVEVRAGVLARPSLSSATGWHDAGYPDTQTVFTDASAPGLSGQPSFWHADVAVTADALNFPSHPTRGGLVQGAISLYRDRDSGHFSFNRYELTAVRLVPVRRDLWTLAIRGSAVLSATAPGNEVPFYQQPSLGGQNALRGYLDYRFHDRNVAALNLESRWAVFAHLDGAVFVEAGEVAPALHSFTATGMKTCYGTGVRLHTGKSTLIRLDFARSPEGWRFLFAMSDPLLFSTFKRWATVVPIVP